MIVKSHYIRNAVLFFSIYSLNAVLMHIRSPDFLWAGEMETLAIFLAAWFCFYGKKRSIRFKSTDEGIFISGSKEGFYDPDFILYSHITACKKEKNRIVIKTKDNKMINLINLGKHRDAVYEEIIHRTRG